MENIKLSGYVKFSGKSEEEKNVITLKLEPEKAELLKEKLKMDLTKYESIPVKLDDQDNYYLKSSSKFKVKIYNNNEEDDDLRLEDIGEDSEVQLFIGIGETSYKRKKYLVAYLKSVNIINLEEPERFNPFADDSDIEEV